MSGDASAILWADWNNYTPPKIYSEGDASAILWADWNNHADSWVDAAGVTLVPFCGPTGTSYLG